MSSGRTLREASRAKTLIARLREGARVALVSEAGTLDDTAWLAPQMHTWTDSKQPWTPIPADANAYYGAADGTLSALWDYRQLGPKYNEALASGRTNLHVQWFNGDPEANAYFETAVKNVIRSKAPH